MRAILSRDPELTLIPRSPPPAFSSILMAPLQSASAPKPARIDVDTATKVKHALLNRSDEIKTASINAS
jgi:hypothetical protein